MCKHDNKNENVEYLAHVFYKIMLFIFDSLLVIPCGIYILKCFGKYKNKTKLYTIFLAIYLSPYFNFSVYQYFNS